MSAHPASDYLRQLQAEAVRGFHRELRAWVDDQSEVARALTAYTALSAATSEESHD